MKILFLFFLSLIISSSALQCEYFDTSIQPNNCDVILSSYNHTDIDQVELEKLKSLISSSTSINSFQLLYQNDLILSIGPSLQLDATVSLKQPFLLALSSILFSDSSHFTYPPFSSQLSQLTPDLQIDIPLQTYLSDILSLQIFDPLNDRYWYGVNVTIELSDTAVPMIEKILESYFRSNLRHVIQKTRTILGLDSFRLDQSNEGNKLIRSTIKDILRFGNIIKTIMREEYSNFSAVYSHFPLKSEDLTLGFKEFKFGWWVNGAEFQGDSSNMFKLAPGDMIASMECTHSLYIAPSWDMVLFIQRPQKFCDSGTNWLAEDTSVWRQLAEVYTQRELGITRNSLGFATSGHMIVNNFVFYSLYCIVGHVTTAYVTKLFWNVSVMLSSKTKFKHA